MRRLSKSPFTIALFALTTFAGITLAQATSQDAYMRSKHGRSTPKTEARVQAEKDSTAYRDATQAQPSKPEKWGEQRHNAKFGRPSPAEEARIAEEQSSTANRDAAPAVAEPQQRDWVNDYHRSKFGRPAPAKDKGAK